MAAAVDAGAFADGLEHFLRFGIREGRDPSAMFNTSYYLSHNPDVADALAKGLIDSAFVHYLQYGGREGRDPSAWFDSSAYLGIYHDVAAAGVNPLSHYLTNGQYENRVIQLADTGLWAG